MSNIDTKNYLEGNAKNSNVAGNDVNINQVQRDINQAQADIVKGGKITSNITGDSTGDSTVTAGTVKDSFNKTEVHHHHSSAESKTYTPLKTDLDHQPKSSVITGAIVCLVVALIFIMKAVISTPDDISKKELEFWVFCKERPSRLSCGNYLKEYPNGAFKQLAGQELQAAESDAAFLAELSNKLKEPTTATVIDD
jgi:hypothetical protein